MGDSHDLDLKPTQKKLLDLRLQKYPDWSFRAVADEIGISHTYLAVLEGRSKPKPTKSGKKSTPSIGKLDTVLSHYGKSLAWLFGSTIPKIYKKKVHKEIHRRLQIVLEGGKDCERRALVKLEDLELWFAARASPLPGQREASMGGPDTTKKSAVSARTRKTGRGRP